MRFQTRIQCTTLPFRDGRKNEKIRDNKGVFAAVLTNLPKGFDCIPHGLLIAKLNAFGFDKKSLSFISAYLYNKKQKTKVGSDFSDFLNILFGVPQGSILGPILIIIFIADLFFMNNDIDFASYADDTAPYVCGQNFSEVIHFLESNVTNVCKWLHENGLMANSSKSHFLISPYETKSIQIQNSCIKASSSEELLRVKIDSNLSFHDHIKSLCSKTNKNLSALSRVSKYMGINKRRILIKIIIFSQFNYCPLVWMCHSRTLNNKINQIQERSLQIELLQKDKFITIHQKNLQYHAIEIYKVKMSISPKIMNEMYRFSKNPVYSLGSGIRLEQLVLILFNSQVNLRFILGQKSGN